MDVPDRWLDEKGDEDDRVLLFCIGERCEAQLRLRDALLRQCRQFLSTTQAFLRVRGYAVRVRPRCER